MQKFGEPVTRDSKDNYCPVDVGILRNSGHVAGPFFDSGRIWIRLAYGGAAGAYAIVQHERLDFRHTVGEAKYLERPLLAHAPELRQFIADESK